MADNELCHILEKKKDLCPLMIKRKGEKKAVQQRCCISLPSLKPCG